jgi:hypothetical protein
MFCTSWTINRRQSFGRLAFAEIVGLIVGGVLASAIVAALLLPRLRSP